MTLKCENISKLYGDTAALSHVELELGRGIYGLLGPNGAGKTTLMRIMTDLLEPSAGRVTLDGVDISYNAVDSEEMDPDQLRYLQEQYDALHVDVSDARTVEVELRVQMRSMGLDESTTIDIPVIQVGRSWYIDVTNLNF